MKELICPWLRSAYERDRFHMVCDLSRRTTMCGGDDTACECPSLLAEDRAGFIEDMAAYQMNGF